MTIDSNEMPAIGILALVRHGESEGNRKNIFTGWRDVELTAQGRREANIVGDQLKDTGIIFDAAFSSVLNRAQETTSIILQRLNQKIEIHVSSALNERNYGDLTGLNKAEAASRWGAAQVRSWRRSFDLAPPGGESLKDTLSRVLPFYRMQILPLLIHGKRVLVIAHSNSLRALIMAIENLSPLDIENVELRTGEYRIYQVAPNGKTKHDETTLRRC